MSIGLDSLKTINDYIKTILYPKPSTTRNQIKKLTKMSNTKIFFLHNSDKTIKTCVCQISPQNNNFSHVLIFSHGNGTDIFTFYPYLKELAVNLKNVLIVCYDYPEYSLSTGELNEHTCYQSLHDVVSFYKKITNNILLVGQSLGTGIVSNYISNNYWVNPVILISPFKSIPQVITQIELVEYLICKNKYATHEKLCKTKCPIKIFHGMSDQLINISHSVELFNIIPNKLLQPTYYKNTGHNDILNKIDFIEYKSILDMIK